MRVALLAAALVASAALAPVGARQDTEVTVGVAGQSSQTPWAAAAGDFVAVAFGAQGSQGGADVYVAVSRNGGRGFGEPVRVNATPGTARLGGELPPRVALVARGGANPEIVVAYGAKATGGEIRIARSTDGGRTFPDSRALQAAGAAGDRGWHAMAVDATGTAHVMWLDHRGLATRAGALAGHHPGAGGQHAEAVASAEQAAIDGVAMAERSGLYYAREGQQSTPESELVTGVCYCCKVALAITPTGGLIAAWRHVYQGNIRDIAFIRSPDGGRHFDPPGRVSADNWHLAGCPDDGPALSVDSRGTAHIAWPTVIDGPAPEGAIFYASSPDARTFSPRLRIPTRGGARPMHPQVMAGAGEQVYVAWDEVIDGVRQAAVRSVRVDDGGHPTFGPALRLGQPGRPSAYPLLVSTPGGPVAVYVSGKAGESVIGIARF